MFSEFELENKYVLLNGTKIERDTKNELYLLHYLIMYKFLCNNVLTSGIWKVTQNLNHRLIKERFLTGNLPGRDRKRHTYVSSVKK